MTDSPLRACHLLASETLELNQSMATVAYIVAGVLFIFSLAGLSHQTSARRGNVLGIIGMLLAIGATNTKSALDALMRMNRNDAVVRAALNEHRSPRAKEAVAHRK